MTNRGNTTMHDRVSRFSVLLELLLNKQFRDFFFFHLKDREDEDEKRKEVQSWGKMKDEGVRIGCYSFDVFLFFFIQAGILVGLLRGAF